MNERLKEATGFSIHAVRLKCFQKVCLLSGVDTRMRIPDVALGNADLREIAADFWLENAYQPTL